MHLASYTDTRLALGGDVSLTLVTDQPAVEVGEIFTRLWLAIYTFEKKFSRFITNSELSIFNRSAGSMVRVSPEFYSLLSAAKSMSIKTNSLFNPFILPMLQRTGYRKSFVKQYEHDRQDDYSNRRVASPEELVLRREFAKIPTDSALDLGGCGKGYLADMLARDRSLSRVQGYWLSLGGDVVGGGTDEYGNAWKVRIEDAATPEKMLDYVFPVHAKTFSIATSGVISRKGRNGKQLWHHLIDPRTGTAASTDILLASVHAKSALEADVLASCAVIVGSDGASEFLASHGVHGSLLQIKGHDRSVEYERFGNIQKLQGVMSA